MTLMWTDALDVLDEMITRESKIAATLLDRIPLTDRDQVVRRAAGVGSGLRLEALKDAKDELVRAGIRHHERQRDGAFIVPNASLEIGGTSLTGYLADDVTYGDLVAAFGEPNGVTDGYKVDAEWVLDVDGEVAVIYNYKTGHNYQGEDGTAVEDLVGRDWHVGSHHNFYGADGEAADFVGKINDYILSKRN